MVQTIRLKQAFIALLLLCFLYILSRLSAEAFLDVGSSWQQGDWLINSHEVMIRRGLLGSIILTLSDLLPLNPAQTVMLLQGVMLLLLAVTVALIALELEGSSALWLLLLSPAFIPIFWAADFSGGLRKELLAYCAFAVLIIAALRGGTGFFVRTLAVAIFALSMLGHEINVLLTPAFLLVFLLTRRGTEPTDGKTPLGQGDLALIGTVIAVAIFSVVFTMLYSSAEDVSPICTPLTDRGMHQGICDGAIATMADQFGDIWGYGFVRTQTELLQFAAVYVVIFALFGLFSRYTSEPRTLWVLFGLLLIPLLPLYPISNDWGRWLNMHMSSATFVIIALMQMGRLKIMAVPTLFLLPVAFTSLFWAPAHTFGMREWGLLGQVGKILGIL